VARAAQFSENFHRAGRLFADKRDQAGAPHTLIPFAIKTSTEISIYKPMGAPLFPTRL
jgi:hypothetical protein